MSVPTLFDKSETSFSTNGLGRLVGSVSCQVTEVGNGLYELEMRYLASDSMYQYLVQDNIIKVKLDDDRGYQCFDIYKVSLPINGIVTVNARHICYRMNYIPIKPFSATGITATLQGLTNNALEVNPFVLSSDITNETSEYNQIEPKSLKACIGGTDGSILDIFSGSGAVELEYDNFNVHIWNHRGSDNGVQIRYGKNLTGFNYTRNTEESYTGAIGYWHDTDQTVNYYGDVQYNSNVGDYGYKKTVIVDFSEQQDTAPTKSQLNAWALAYITNIGIAKENITVNFVNLADTEEYKDIAPLETVGLFDTVHVFYEPYGLTVEKKVIKTVYDVLKERYASIEIGDKKSSLSNTLIETSATVSKMVSVTQKIDREIGEITQTIGSVEERLDNLQIGATNLLLDSNAPSLTKVSAPYNRYFSDNGRSGYISAEIVEISDTPYGEMYGAEYEVIGEVTSTGHRILAFYQTASIPLIVGEEYTVSCYARVVTAGDNELAVAFQIGTSPYVTSHQPITSTEWQKYSYTFTATSNLINTSGYTRVYCGGIYCLSGTTAGKIQTVGFMFERGNQATDWEPNADDLETTIATTETRLSNEISSTAEQTKQTITAETQTKLETLQGAITTNYEKYTNERVDSAQSTIQTWTSERYDTNIENLQDDVGDLQTDVNNAQSSINTIQFSISSLQASITAINNGIGKAFVVDSTGTKVFAVENNERIPGTYTLTDEDGNHYFVSNVETSWATATEFGCVQLSIGKDVNDTARWRTVMNENTLDDIYHA